jgi:hypothetical protein
VSSLPPNKVAGFEGARKGRRETKEKAERWKGDSREDK